MRFEKGNKVGNRATKNNKLAVKHSLHTYRRWLEPGGHLRKNSPLQKFLCEEAQELTTALGGDPSPQQRLLIADAVKTMVYIGTLDQYLMSLDGGIIKN